MAPIKLSCSPSVFLEMRHCISLTAVCRLLFDSTSSGHRMGSASVQVHSRGTVPTAFCCEYCRSEVRFPMTSSGGAGVGSKITGIASTGVEVICNGGVRLTAILSSPDVSDDSSISLEGSSLSSQACDLWLAGRSQSFVLCWEEPHGCPLDFIYRQWLWSSLQLSPC